MSTRPVTLDMSTSVPIKPVTLDMTTSVPLVQGATAEAMQREGVTDYQPGQGLPYPRLGGIRSGDITPTQAEGGAAAIGGATGIAAAGPAVLANLGKIVQVAKAVGMTGFGLKEAHDLYKMFTSGSK